MKYIQTLLISFLISYSVVGQEWNSTGNNVTSGNLSIGSIAKDSYSKLTINGPNLPIGIGSKRDLSFEFAAAGKAQVSAYRGGSWNTFMQFLTTPSTGGDPQVRMHINDNGNVGIGTTSPTMKIHLDNLGNSDGIQFGSKFKIRQSGVSDNNFVMENIADNGSLYLRARSNTTSNSLGNLILNDQGGNVGIGTVHPSEKLHVNGLIRLPLANSEENNSPGIVAVSNDDFLYDGEYLNHYGIGFHDYSEGENVTNRINAYMSGYRGVNLFTKGQHRMRIDIDGNVGIGTVTPTEKLEIRGNLKVNNGSSYSTIRLGQQSNDAIIADNSSGNNYGGGYWFRVHDESVSHKYRDVMMLADNGNVGIGIADTKGFKLGVNGKIAATEVKVALVSNWPDYVFENEYELPTLNEVEKHITEKGHLKDIPSAAEVTENGILLGDMNVKLLQKIEELTLYTIQQEKVLKAQEDTNAALIARLAKLEALLLK